MAKKRIGLYGAMLLIFVVFWSIYTALSMRSAGEVTRQVVLSEVDAAEIQYSKALAYQAKDFKLSLYAENGGAEIKTERLFSVLSRLEMQTPGWTYYALLGDSGLYGADGSLLTGSVPAEALATAREAGYSYFPAPEALGGEARMALAVPASDDLDGYFVQVRPMGEFAASLRPDLALSTDYLALYDGSGNRTALVTTDWDDRIFAAEQDDGIRSSLSRSESTLFETLRLIESETADYAQDPQPENLIPASSQYDYHIFIPLSQPTGWLMSGRISTNRAYPIQSGIFQVTMIAFVCWILMIAGFIVLDIALERQKQRELLTASNVDALTKLSNSTAATHTFDEFFRKHKKVGYSMVCLDIVAFHRYNTLFGHDSGDRLLRVIAGVINDHYYCGVRMSADVFIFLARNSERLVRELEQLVSKAIQLELGPEYHNMISFKIGVYPIMDPDHTFHEIYDGALLALKDAKRTPEQSEVIYDVHLQRTVDIERTIEMNMLQALANEEFLVYIQPKFTVATKECCGGEALVRWQSSQMGLMPPDAFVPLFERNGFIVEIDFYMLDKVLQHLQRDLSENLDAHPISVNMSKITLTFPNYLERLKNMVKKHRVPPRYVELEITESVLERTGSSVITLMQELRDQGFAISMDDFGSGFSSLNSLRELPVDTLKIDKEFLRQSDESDRSKKIIKNVINMGKELGAEVVCEGVENDSQFCFLRDSGCDVVQGYYFSKPMPYSQYKRDYLHPVETGASRTVPTIHTTT